MRQCLTIHLIFISIGVSSQISFRIIPLHISPLVYDSPAGTYSIGAGVGAEPHQNIFLSLDAHVNLPALGLDPDSYLSVQNSDGHTIATGLGTFKSYGIFYKSAYTIDGNDSKTFYLASGLGFRHITRYLEVNFDSEVSDGHYYSSKIIMPVSFYLGYKAESDVFFSDIYLGLSFNLFSGSQWKKPLEDEFSSENDVQGISIVFGVTYCLGKE